MEANKNHSIVFFGSKRAGLEICHLLGNSLPSGIFKAIVCPDDSSDARSEMPNFELFSSETGIPLTVVKDSRAAKKILTDYQPSIVIVHGWYQMLPVGEFDSVLFLGFHYSPLPKYRGNAPLVWQIINGEENLGVSFFELTEGMDEGGLVDQKLFSIKPEDTIAEALRIAGELTIQLLTDFLDKPLDREVQLKKQTVEGASYCGLRLPNDGKIDWKGSASNIHNFIRAQSKPYPGAFTHLADSRKLIIWESVIENKTYYGVPGSVVKYTDEYIVVACGEGAIRIKDVQIDELEGDVARSALKSLRLRFD